MCGAPTCESGWGFRILCWTRRTSAVSIGAHMEVKPKRHKRGDVREDGMVFWRYHSAGGEQWLAPDKHKIYSARTRGYAAERKSSFSTKRRPLSRGDADPTTGLIFWAYAESCQNGEQWVTPEKYAQKFNTHRENQRAWGRNNRAAANAISKRALDNNPALKHSVRVRSRLRKGLLRGAKGEPYEFLRWLHIKLGVPLRAGSGWEVDHLYSWQHFDLTTPDGEARYNGIENVWILPGFDNKSKGSKDPTPDQVSLHATLLAEYRQTLK